MTRTDGRAPDELRTTRMTPAFTIHAEGSVLVEAGGTRGICTASGEGRGPPLPRPSGKGEGRRRRGGHPAPRSRLRRGLAGRWGYERREGRRRAVHRSAGDRRRTAV